MTGPNNKEELLADVLAEASETGLHEVLLGETLRLARRRRHFRRAQRVSGVLAVATAIVALTYWQVPRTPDSVQVQQPVAQSFQLTRTQILPPDSVVSTQPFAADRMVTSTTLVGVVRTTADSGGYRVLGDDELLALAPEPAALVRRGTREAELVFVPLPAAGDSHQN